MLYKKVFHGSIACYIIFSSFGQFANTTSEKIFPLCCELFVERFFHIFAQTKALLSKYVTQTMQTSGKRKETSLVSKPHGVGRLPSRVLPTCREPILPYGMECCRKGKWVCVSSFGSVSFWPFFKQRTVQIDQLLLVTFSINRSPMFWHP